MSTIATKFSAATTQFKVGTAAVAVVAAATITPAVAEATPSFASISQASGSSALSGLDVPVLPVVGGGLNASFVGEGSSAAAVPPVFAPIAAVLNFGLQVVGGIVYVSLKTIETGLNFVGATGLANAVGGAANSVAQAFRVGPYAT